MMTDAFDPDFASPADWVIAYRALNLNVIPATEKKHPVVNWKEFQQGLVPAAVLDRWYGPDGEYSRSYSMGFLTGPASLGEGEALLGIDCDAKEIDGRQTWQGWLDVHENGIEPETWKARTGSGGRHIFFRYPSSIIIRNAQGKYRGIDVRAEGGFIMAAPSAHYIRGTHYEWEEGCDPLQGAEIADAPQWLIEICQDIQEAPRAEAGERVEASGSYDAWGNRTDGREAYMRDVVWAAVLDLHRTCPIKPGADESLAAMQRAYDTYARNVRSRIPGDNEVGLEREGRGLSLFQVKWDMAMRQWDRKVAEEAARPPKPKEAPKVEQHADDAGPFPASDFVGEPPVREWIVDQWVPRGVVTALYGDGGLGKTLLAQQLLYAASIGGDWCGIKVPKLRGLGVFCEDDRDELHRRHKSIAAHLGSTIGNPFGDAVLWPRVGYDNLLVAFDRNNVPTLFPFYERLWDYVRDSRIELLILDNAADLFGGNEIIRAQVNYFIKAVCGGLIQRCASAGWSLTIVLLAHPSQSGKASGSGESGSTAWNNAVRSRLYLKRPDDGSKDDRLLTRMKANYAASGDETALPLMWAEGVIRPVKKAAQAAPNFDVHAVLKQELDRAWKAGKPWSMAPQTRHEGRFAPRSLSAQLGIPANEIQRIIQAWLDNGVVAVEEADRHRKTKGIKVLVW